MAKTSKNGTARSARSGADDALPEGFDELSFGRVRGWFVMKQGNVIQGRMRDSFTTDGQYGERRTYKIEVTKGACAVFDGETEKEVLATVGDVIGLDEKGFLKRLADVPQGAEVYVRCMGKAAPTKEFPQGAWSFKLGVARGTQLRQRQRKESDRPTAADDGPLPF